MKDFNVAMEKPRKVALYASLTINDFYAMYEVRDLDFDTHYQPLPEGQTRESPVEGWVRISEPAEVTFRPMSSDAVVRQAVESLEETERKVIDEMNQKLAQIRERKHQLLALTYQPTAV